MQAMTPSWIASLVQRGGIVFDGRMFFSEERISEFRQYGLKVKGVGR
jgi:hypothetical protein